MNENILSEKSLQFAIRTVKLTKLLQESKKEFILSKQIIRSGTAIGALIREANFAESKKDFTHKLNIALKEANETEYWLTLIKEMGCINPKEFESLRTDVIELIKILVASIKTVKSKLNNL